MDTYHPDNLHLREQGCEDPWLFLEAKRGPRAKSSGEHFFKRLTRGRSKGVLCARHVTNVLRYCDVFITQRSNKKCKNVNRF